MAGHDEAVRTRASRRSSGELRARRPQNSAHPDRCPGAAAQLAAVHRILRHGPVLQLEAAGGGGPAADASRPTRANRTGLPDRLKSGVEALSGIALDEVKVHYNSSKPAQLGALAYAQGSDIHLALGQERHLPHEAWHVVQQAQGRVRPTRQLTSGIPVNDDAGLEREADVMGTHAAATNVTRSPPDRDLITSVVGSGRQGDTDAQSVRPNVAQRILLPIQGDDTDEVKSFVKRRIENFAQQDSDIAAMIASRSFSVYVTVNRDAEGVDQETRVDFNPETRRTILYVTMNQIEADTDVHLAADLLHEFVLHGIPAYAEHRRAEAAAALPNFPESEEAIEAEEAIEHGDFDAWLKMAAMALRGGGPALEVFDRVLIDLLNHAEEVGLSDDEQMAISAILDRDWTFLAQEGYDVPGEVAK